MVRVTIFTRIKNGKKKIGAIELNPLTFTLRDFYINFEARKWDLVLNRTTRIGVFKSNFSTDIHSLNTMVSSYMLKRWTTVEFNIYLVYPDTHRYAVLPHIPSEIKMSLNGMKFYFTNDFSYINEKIDKFKSFTRETLHRTYSKPTVENRYRMNSKNLLELLEHNLNKYLASVNIDNLKDDTANLLNILKDVEVMKRKEHSGYISLPTEAFEVSFIHYIINAISEFQNLKLDKFELTLKLRALEEKCDKLYKAIKTVRGTKPLRVIWDNHTITIETESVQRLLWLFYTTIQFCDWYGNNISKTGAVVELMENIRFILDLKLEQAHVSPALSQFLIYLETVYDQASLYGDEISVDKSFLKLEKLRDYVTNMLQDLSTIFVTKSEDYISPISIVG